MKNVEQILKKLRIRGHDPVLIVNAPSEYKDVLSALEGRIDSAPQQKYRFIHVFVRIKRDIQQYVPSAIKALDGDGLLWISYPKKSSKKYQSDISRDSGWETIAEYNFEPVTQISINDDWSALRFRQVEHIKTMKRKFALSEKGKERISNKSV